MRNFFFENVKRYLRLQFNSKLINLEHKFYTWGMILVGLAICLCRLSEKSGHILEVSSQILHPQNPAEYNFKTMGLMSLCMAR